MSGGFCWSEFACVATRPREPVARADERSRAGRSHARCHRVALALPQKFAKPYSSRSHFGLTGRPTAPCTSLCGAFVVLGGVGSGGGCAACVRCYVRASVGVERLWLLARRRPCRDRAPIRPGLSESSRERLTDRVPPWVALYSPAWSQPLAGRSALPPGAVHVALRHVARAAQRRRRKPDGTVLQRRRPNGLHHRGCIARMSVARQLTCSAVVLEAELRVQTSQCAVNPCFNYPRAGFRITVDPACKGRDQNEPTVTASAFVLVAAMIWNAASNSRGTIWLWKTTPDSAG